MGVSVNVSENVTRITVTVKEFSDFIELSDIQFETLPDGTKGINLDWLREALGVVVPQPNRVLTFEVEGLPDNVDLIVNGEVAVNRRILYANGTVLPQLILSAQGYNLDPDTISAGLVMDEDKTENITATQIVGRVFNVGTGTGDLTIDGSDNTKNWFPLQANDEFRILGTSLNRYNNIYLKDLKAADGSSIRVTNQTGIITVDRIWTYGSKMNVVLDFHNKVNGEKYGCFNNWGSNNGEKMIINSDGADEFSLTVYGIKSENFFDKGWQLMPKNKAYNNGAGKSAAKLIEIQNCAWVDGACQGEGGLDLGGDFYEGVDNCFVERLIFKNNLVQNGDYGFGGRNIGYYEVKNITLIDVNPNTPADGAGTYHKRTLDFFGHGSYENITAKRSYGVVCRSVSFSRGSTKETNIIKNIVSDENPRYSAVEVNTYEAEQRNLPGISTEGFTKVLGVTTKDLGSAGIYTSTCVDIFGSGDNVIVKNCVAINPFIDGSSEKFAINGPASVQLNNYAYSNNNLTKLNLSTYKPAADSVLKGAGVADADFLTDLYNQIRLSIPTVGAVEAS